MAELSDKKVKQKPPRTPNKWEITRTILAVFTVVLQLSILYITIRGGR